MIHFTRLVKTSGRLREFNYKKNSQAGEQVFDVDTADDRGNRLFFKLEKDNGEWVITSKTTLPAWITDNKEDLVRELEYGLEELNA